MESIPVPLLHLIHVAIRNQVLADKQVPKTSDALHGDISIGSIYFFRNLQITHSAFAVHVALHTGGQALRKQLVQFKIKMGHPHILL